MNDNLSSSSKESKSEQFLSLLDKEAVKYLFSCFDYNRKLPPKDHIYGSYSELEDELHALNKEGYCVYVAVNRMSGEKRGKDYCSEIRDVWSDDDHPRDEPLDTFPLAPSLIVETSKGKYQYHWFTRTKDFNAFEKVMQTMVNDWGCDKKALGTARVLRLPGFNHNKDLDNPFPSRIVGGSTKTYEWSEITKAFPPAEKVVQPNSDNKGKFDKSAAIESLRTGENYHNSLCSLAMRYANNKLNTDEIVTLLSQLMDDIPVGQRRAEWADRRAGEHLRECARSAVNKLKDEKSSDAKERRDLPEPKLTNSKPINRKYFPKEMWDAAQEVADWTATQAINPPILAAVGTISSLLAKNVEIHEIDEDLVHPCSMGIIVGENTGTRKTEIYKKMGAPYFQYERDIQAQWDGESAERKVTADLLKNELRKRTKASSKGGNRSFSDITATAKEIANLQENLDKLQNPKPCLIVEDITEEKLVRVLDTQNCSISIFSDDARNMIRNVSGMRKQDGSGENLYLKGFTNGDYVYSRVGTDGKFDDLYLRDICLNMFAFVQPDMVSKLIGTSDISSSGMAARLFIYIQEIDVDYMLEHADRRPLDKSKMEPYYKSLEHLCQRPEQSVKVTLSNEAGEHWVVFNKRIAELLRGDWKGEYELVNKIVTLSTKMAAVFLAIKTKDFYSHSEIEIDLDTYKSACEFVEFLGGQTIGVYKMLDQSIADRGARTVSSNLQNKYEKDGEIPVFKLNARFCNTQSKPLRGKEIMSEILDILEEYGHVVKNGDLYTYVPSDDGGQR